MTDTTSPCRKSHDAGPLTNEQFQIRVRLVEHIRATITNNIYRETPHQPPNPVIPPNKG